MTGVSVSGWLPRIRPEVEGLTVGHPARGWLLERSSVVGGSNAAQWLAAGT